MSRIMNDLMSSLGKTLGFPDLCFDPTGYCALGFDDFLLNMQYIEATEQLFLSVSVAGLPEGNRQPLYELLLQGNCGFAQTGGATLGVNEENGVVLSAHIKVITLDSLSFETLIDNFLTMAESWRERIALMPDAGKAPSATVRLPRDGFMPESLLRI